MEFDQNRIAYLQMVQGAIDRMSAKSANVKGFATAIVAGISAISFNDTKPWALLMAFLTVLIFLDLNVYYLGMERRYRFIYDQIRLNPNKLIDFDMKPDLKESEIKKAEATFSQCLTSVTIRRFYIPITIIMITIVLMNSMEVL